MREKEKETNRTFPTAFINEDVQEAIEASVTETEVEWQASDDDRTDKLEDLNEPPTLYSEEMLRELRRQDSFFDELPVIDKHSQTDSTRQFDPSKTWMGQSIIQSTQETIEEMFGEAAQAAGNSNPIEQREFLKGLREEHDERMPRQRQCSRHGCEGQFDLRGSDYVDGDGDDRFCSIECLNKEYA